MSTGPVWEGEILELALARKAVVRGVLRALAAEHGEAVTLGEPGGSYTHLDEMILLAAKAVEAYRAKDAVITAWREGPQSALAGVLHVVPRDD